MYCKECGNQLNPKAVVCPKCGCAVEGRELTTASQEGSTFGWAALGFVAPAIGFILYFVFKNEHPKRAKSLCKGAWWSIGLYIFWIILMIIAES